MQDYVKFRTIMSPRTTQIAVEKGFLGGPAPKWVTENLFKASNSKNADDITDDQIRAEFDKMDKDAYMKDLEQYIKDRDQADKSRG